MKYGEVVPIRSRPAGVWLVQFEFPGSQAIETKQILVVDKEMTPEEVVQIVRTHHPNRRFTILQIWVGEFEVSRVENSYSADGRRVTQDLEVIL